MGLTVAAQLVVDDMAVLKGPDRDLLALTPSSATHSPRWDRACLSANLFFSRLDLTTITHLLIPRDAVGRLATARMGCAKIDTMLTTLTAYFDDAGGVDHGFTVVSGWVSTVAKWRQFDTDWKLLLAHYDLPYFSMKECSQFKGVFEKWRKYLGTRDNFLRGAAGIIKSHVLYGFGAVALHNEFDAANREYNLKEYVGSPYALAGQMCVKHALEWGRNNGYVGWKIAFVFDEGTPKWGTLKTLMKREGLADPIFCSPRDSYHEGEPQKGLTPLQAADFLAYELRKIKRDDPDELWPISKYRKTIRALVSVPSYWGQCKKSDLDSLCQKHPKIKPRKAA